MTAPRGLWIAALLVLSALAEPTEAQSRAVLVTGRVVGPDGAPVLLAAVTVTALDDQSSVVELTDGEGRYHVVMAHRAATYAVSVRLRGFVAQSRPVAVGIADSLVSVPDFRLVRTAQDLPTVKVVSRRPPPMRDQERSGLYQQKPGESERTIVPSAGFSSALTGDVTGDLTLALGAIPGVAVTAGADGTLSFSLAGLSGDQNRATLNGADASVAPPRDGGVMRVSTTGYDPTVAMSGVRSDWLIIGANNLVARRIRLTTEARSLQIATPVADATGRRTTTPTILSGVISGPLARRTRPFVPRFFTTSFDVRRRASEVATLTSTDASTLGALGADADLVRRILTAREGLGLPAFAGGRVDQATTSASVYTRLDFTDGSVGVMTASGTGDVGVNQNGPDQARVLYLLAGGSASQNTRSAVGPLTLPSYGSNGGTSSLSVQAFHSAYFREFIVNETRLSLRSERVDGEPSSLIPAASVIMTPATPTASTATGSVQAAGGGGAPYRSRYSSAQLFNETQWSSVGGRHQWKLGLEALLDDASTSTGASAGRFEFASVDEFIANRPAAYTRSVLPTSSDAHGVHLAAGLGDEYHPSKAWSWQYGVRFEGHAVRDGAAMNPLVDSVYGVRTGAIPMTVSISPMVGFTWFYGKPWGKNAMGFPSGAYSLVGGLRDYRGDVSTRSAQGVLSESGLAGAGRELRCVGEAVPTPDWHAFEASSASIPDRCADGSVGSPLAASGSPVSVYSRDYVQGHSWRADLAWNTRLSARVFSVLHGRLAMNARQPSTRDLNFAGNRRFGLAAEDGRPVFVTPVSFDSVSGFTTAAESRRNPLYDRVTEMRSDLRSHNASITASLAFRPVISPISNGRALPFDLSYTLSGGRQQTNGFAGATAGDPREIEWESSRTSRHVVLLGTALHVPDWMRVTAGLQLRSGVRYTPVVRGDANGDGLSGNDRAFVFDPGSMADTALAAGMRRLLESAPARAARCLRSALGTIAGAQQCVGPWLATLNGSVAVNPARVGLRNRGTLELRVTNVLAAVDQLIHGAGGARGWGQAAYPDPVLLQIRGFDPTARVMRYAVNPSFGDPRIYRNLFQSPFRISLDVSLDIGPNREREAILERVGPAHEAPSIRLDSAQIAVRLSSNRRRLLDPIVNEASALELTEKQRETLDTLSRRYETSRDSIYGALSGYLASRDGDLASPEARRRWHDANVAVAWKIWETGAAVRSLLSDAQWSKLFDGISVFNVGPFAMDRRELTRMLATWRTSTY